ncbi:putative glycoside hydrolase [Erwinia phage Kuerle]|nr:putative glycoside hydrolase [Erwinia phage Kuerle]
MRQARFTISLSAASTGTVTVGYATVDGTAVAGTDYTATSGTATFEPGETSKDVLVPVRDYQEGIGSLAFTLALSTPSGGTLGTKTSGSLTIPGDPAVLPSYLDRFHTVYTAVHNVNNGYFGPPTGAAAHTMPYHCIETLICEAPDWGHETVSETASFYVGLEAWKGLLDNDWTGFNKAWNTISTIYVPNNTNQPLQTYNAGHPADYTPEGDTPNAYPVLGDSTAAVGIDPLYDELLTTYGNKQMFLMHWIIDVDGAYGFKNGDGSKLNVYINNYQRGLQESAWETITQPEWEDFTYGSTYGFLPLFQQGLPVYEEAENEYGTQWRYTSAPDAEARAIQWSFWANKWATANGKAGEVATSYNYAKKMGDYLRYCLFDKYFRQIGTNRAQGSTTAAPYTACHYLISWYISWGGQIPVDGQGYWGFRIGSSESHFGYQAPDIAYFMATGGGGMTPLSASAGDIWLGSMYKQLEMIRWLQTLEGPIAGGVSNSWKGRYETPNDGRDNFTFYGMYYTYAPVWHDPPSNNWFGFQAWGLGRVADLMLEVATVESPSTMQTNVYNMCETILDRFCNWCVNNITMNTESLDFTLPDTLNWTSPTQVLGETTNSPNLEGVYEYIPSTKWDGTGDSTAFWNPASVPNPLLKFRIVASGKDLGVASSLALLMLHYAKAKRVKNKFDTAMLASDTNTPNDVYKLAKNLVDGMWSLYWNGVGIAREEARSDYNKYNQQLYVPNNYTGYMPNGDVINSSSTFISIRSWQKADADWPKIQAYLDSQTESTIPKFTYHRFWAQCEYAMCCGALHQYFSDIN